MYFTPVLILIVILEIADNPPSKNVLHDRDHLREAQVLAHSDTESAESRFRTWATKYVEGAKYMNVGSGPQIRQLFYSGAVNQKPTKKDEYLEMERAFKVAPVASPPHPEVNNCTPWPATIPGFSYSLKAKHIMFCVPADLALPECFVYSAAYTTPRADSKLA